MPESAYEKSNKKWTASSIAAGIGGLVMGRYFGANLWVPAGLIAAVWWAAKKFFPEPKQVLVPAFSIQAGQALWMALASVIMASLAQTGFDLLVLVGGLIWLYKGQGRGALYLLGAYQLLSMLYNVSVLFDQAAGSQAHKALLVHIILRGAALFFMGQLFFRKPEPEEEEFAETALMD